MPVDARNWFAQGGDAYARFRPEYPLELTDVLAELAPATRTAVDVGCGTGQLTVQLASRFDQVVGLDPSEAQIANASPHERVRYACAPAERLPVADGVADLVAVAQAAHWFDLPAFYDEARRIAAPGAVLALVSYGVLELEPDLADRFQRFYTDEIGPFWPPQRRLVDEGYRTILFPFDELPAPELDLARDLTLDALLGYISTWSAVRSARDAGRDDLLTTFANDLTVLWGDRGTSRRVTWPLNLRLARL